MEVQTAVSQIVPALRTSYKRFEGSVYADHDRIRYYNDHHVTKSNRSQVHGVVHVRYEKHADLVLNLNQKKTQNRWNRKTHKLFDCIGDLHNFFWSAVVCIELKRGHAFDIFVILLNHNYLVGSCDSLGEEIVF